MFRVWNKRIKQMLAVERIFFNEDTVEVGYGFTGSDKGTWFLEHCELMQFTGAFDNNVIRIFEGDILDCSATEEYKKYTGKYVCTFSNENSFVLQELLKFKQEIYDSGFPINWGGFKSKKIIGNIFQNPELLTESQ